MGGTLLVEAVWCNPVSGQYGNCSRFILWPPRQREVVLLAFKPPNVRTWNGYFATYRARSAAGTTFTLNSANQYTLRIRVHCPEFERSQAIYYSLEIADLSAPAATGVLAPGKIQMEIQEFVSGVGATPVTLYDGGLANLPGTCMAVPASSINLIGTMRAFNLTNLGSGWVVSTPPQAAHTRGVLAQRPRRPNAIWSARASCFLYRVCARGGEQIAASYRTMGKAVGRAVNTAIRRHWC